MFETDRQVLSLILRFAVTGFALGFIYNIGRFIRLTLPAAKKTAFVLDVLFMLISALVIFVFSVGNGTGFFRLYYVFTAVFGFAVYMITLGMATPVLAKAVSFCAGKVFTALRAAVICVVISPVKIFCIFIKQKTAPFFIGFYQKISKLLKNLRIHLKSKRKMVYNDNNSIIGKLSRESGESGHAVKAKVRRFT